MITIIANEKAIKIKAGQNFEDILDEHFPDLKYVTNVVADGVLRELFEHYKDENELEFISAKTNEEAARTYARGVSFLLYRAVKKYYHGKRKVIIDHALSGGLYCEMADGEPIVPHDVVEIERIMGEMVEADTNFIYNKVPKEAAIKLFENDGQMDKVELLKYRPLSYFRYYENDGDINYFFGKMVPSTGYLKDFKLFTYAPGFIVKYPSPYQTETHVLEEEPKLAATFNRSERWARLLHVANVADINMLEQNGELADFIKVNETLHESQLVEIVKQIVSRPQARLILIAGPSSSGKTTFAGRLRTHLKVLGKTSYSVSLDDYYIDRDKLPYDENGKQDFETIDALDTHLFNQNMVSLLDGKETKLPIFSFSKGSREKKGRKMTLDKNALLIVEGIHGLNEELTRLIPHENKFKIFISPLNTLNLDNHNIVYPEDLRLLRRLVRDQRARGYEVSTTLEMWED
ncbi:MAG: nucleoside kinase, partial [Eubacteriales bacterium]